MTFSPTDQQLACVTSARSRQSLMISAYAGCAKTTTLELAGKEIKVPALALAFNVSIKNELAKRFSSNFTVKTMNGLGFQALGRAHRHVSFQPPEPRKLGKIISQIAKDEKVDLIADAWADVKALTQSAMYSGIVPKDEGRPLTEDNEENWIALMDNLGILPDDYSFFYNLAYKTLERNNELVKQGIISFDDQVYYSTCIAGDFPLFPVMLIDEAQDLSGLNHAMLTLSRRPDGRILACGDPKQAIYAFRGADSASMRRLRKLRPEPEWDDLPLTLTFRCPKVVVARQQVHAPGFEAAPSNAPGTFVKIGDWDDLEGLRLWNWEDVLAVTKGRPLAILSRNNAPLIAMAFKLLRKRVTVRMAGRDIGKGLITLSRKLFPADAMGKDEMVGLLNDWRESEVSAAIANDKQEAADAAYDRAESLSAVISFAEVEDAGRLRETLRVLFEREDGQVLLSTIHRAKGLEWDAVLHLDPWRVPSKWAKAANTAGNPVPLDQEMNLKYVCETRTRDVLIEADLKGFK